MTPVGEAAVRRFRALSDAEFDRTTAVVVALLALDAVWWIAVYAKLVPVPGMRWLMTEAQVPMAAPGAMELAVFRVGTAEALLGYVVAWGAMMWAMMYPAMTRFGREYADALRGSTRAVAGTVVAFFAGYSLTWALSAAVPLAIHAALPRGIHGTVRAAPHLALGGVLALTGLYQLSSFKRARLRSCCARVAPRDAVPAAGLRRGLRHGLDCALVCFAPLFLVMPFFGEMNPFWMVALTAVVTVERLPTWGEELAVASGAVSLTAGAAAILLRPALPLALAL